MFDTASVNDELGLHYLTEVYHRLPKLRKGSVQSIGGGVAGEGGYAELRLGDSAPIVIKRTPIAGCGIPAPALREASLLLSTAASVAAGSGSHFRPLLPFSSEAFACRKRLHVVQEEADADLGNILARIHAYLGEERGEGAPSGTETSINGGKRSTGSVIPSPSPAQTGTAAPFLSDIALRALFLGILQPLAELHDSGWMHRDLKPQNVLLVTRECRFPRDGGMASPPFIGALHAIPSLRSPAGTDTVTVTPGVRLGDLGMAAAIPGGPAVQVDGGVEASAAAEAIDRRKRRDEQAAAASAASYLSGPAAGLAAEEEGSGHSAAVSSSADLTSPAVHCGAGEGEMGGEAEEEEDGSYSRDYSHFESLPRFKGGLHPQVVSVPYRAPELLFAARTHGAAVDSWAAGALLLEVLRAHVTEAKSLAERRNGVRGVDECASAAAAAASCPAPGHVTSSASPPAPHPSSLSSSSSSSSSSAVVPPMTVSGPMACMSLGSGGASSTSSDSIIMSSRGFGAALPLLRFDTAAAPATTVEASCGCAAQTADSALGSSCAGHKRRWDDAVHGTNSGDYGGYLSAAAAASAAVGAGGALGGADAAAPPADTSSVAAESHSSKRLAFFDSADRQQQQQPLQSRDGGGSETTAGPSRIAARLFDDVETGAEEGEGEKGVQSAVTETGCPGCPASVPAAADGKEAEDVDGGDDFPLFMHTNGGQRGNSADGGGAGVRSRGGAGAFLDRSYPSAEERGATSAGGNKELAQHYRTFWGDSDDSDDDDGYRLGKGRGRGASTSCGGAGKTAERASGRGTASASSPPPLEPLFGPLGSSELTILSRICKMMGPSDTSLFPSAASFSGYMGSCSACFHCGSGVRDAATIAADPWADAEEDAGETETAATEGGSSSSAAAAPSLPPWLLPQTLADSCAQMAVQQNGSSSSSTAATPAPLFHACAIVNIAEWLGLKAGTEQDEQETRGGDSTSGTGSAWLHPLPEGVSPHLPLLFDLCLRMMAWEPSRRLLPSQALQASAAFAFLSPPTTPASAFLSAVTTPCDAVAAAAAGVSAVASAPPASGLHEPLDEASVHALRRLTRALPPLPPPKARQRPTLFGGGGRGSSAAARAGHGNGNGSHTNVLFSDAPSPHLNRWEEDDSGAPSSLARMRGLLPMFASGGSDRDRLRGGRDLTGAAFSGGGERGNSGTKSGLNLWSALDLEA